MRQVYRIQTLDGVLHESKTKANKHLESKYADVLCPIAHKLTQMKYTDILEYIDSHLDLFQSLIAIKADMFYISDNEES